jgi:hypothetical protein
MGERWHGLLSYLRGYSDENVLRSLNFRPECEFVGLFLAHGHDPVHQMCDRTGDYVVISDCCRQSLILCTSHLRAAESSEWAECLRCHDVSEQFGTAEAQRISSPPAC